jgi:hypothetical protein
MQWLTTALGCLGESRGKLIRADKEGRRPPSFRYARCSRPAALLSVRCTIWHALQPTLVGVGIIELLVRWPREEHCG